jgi:flagella basal body P-ring formation protein FlgA
MKILRVAVALACMLSTFPGTVLAGQAIPLVLRAEVVLDHPIVVLADLVELPVALAADVRLGTLPVAKAPRVGQALHLSRLEIERSLKRQKTQLDLLWQGERSVTVRSKAQTIGEAGLRDAAIARLRDELAWSADDSELTVAAPIASIDIPARPYRLVARQAVPTEGSGARRAVWVDVLIDDSVYRSVLIPLNVTHWRPVLVARRPLGAGDRVEHEAFVEREENLAALPAPPFSFTKAEQVRLRRPLRAGQVLTADLVAGARELLRGDRVRVVLRASGIDVETEAIALAPALPGQQVAVRTSTRNETLTGRLSVAGTVVIE